MRPTRTPSAGTRRSRAAAQLGLGAVGGLVAGAAFLALNSWFATTTGNLWFAPFRTIATLVEGPPPGDGTVWIGVVVHIALSVLFGMILAVLVAAVRVSRAALAFIGLAFGGLLYLLNFQVLSRSVEYWSAFLTATNQPFELAAHLVFGAVLSLFLIPPPRRQPERRGDSSPEVMS